MTWILPQTLCAAEHGKGKEEIENKHNKIRGNRVLMGQLQQEQGLARLGISFYLYFVLLGNRK